jgi:hypothetical protein
MMDSTEVLLESFVETQLKLKILHSSKSIYLKDMESLKEVKTNIMKLFLKVLYSVSLKKVLSSKSTHRITLKFFKKFIFASSSHNLSDISHNKMTLDKCYLNTLAINSLYEFYITKVE